MRSVSGRLMVIVLLTTGLALLVAATGLLYTDLQGSRRTWAQDLVTEAAILALANAPALSFDDQQAAHRSLAALQAKRSIIAAALYAPDGIRYADYARAGQLRAPATVPVLSPGVHVVGEQIEVLEPVVQGGEVLGAIYLRAHHDVTGRVSAYAGIVAVVMFLSLGIALLASSRLQRAISGPMASMAAVARGLTERRDYSLRANKVAEDEIGLVVDAFNRMLDEVQSRTHELQASNTALQEEARVRQSAEQALRQSERLYRAIGESIDYGVWVCDAEGRNTYASDSFLRLAGITQEECSSFGWGDLLHPDDRDATIAAWKNCVSTGCNWYREHRIRGTDGKYHAILAQGVAIRDENGRVVRWAGINLDISRLKLTEDALREADRRKDEFLATLAHELRNPLAPIQNAVRILNVPTGDERQRRWGREVIARQVRHMALLLDDLLDVSRITRGQLELKKDYVDFQSIVDAAVETARPLIDAKEHTLTIALPEERLTLEADPLRLSQVISNLLTNAAKYTDRGGRVALAVEVTAEGLTLSVTDNGIGLAPESIPQLFNIFSQVTTALDRAEGGLGIGLSLVKGLVTLHGGSVEVRSEGLGRGSEFRIRLPRRMIVSHELAREAAEGRTAPWHAKPRAAVLVVDDNHDSAESLALVLQHAGYTTVTASSGAEALDAAARLHPQAIILDVGMPGMSGYEVARRIRLEAWGMRVILIAVTGWGQPDDQQRAKVAGFDAHFTKPADPDEVERMLAAMLARRTRAHVDDRRGH